MVKAAEGRPGPVGTEMVTVVVAVPVPGVDAESVTRRPTVLTPAVVYVQGCAAVPATNCGLPAL